MKNYFIFYLTVLISSTIFSQNETFIISNETKTNKTGSIFEIKNKTIKSKKYEIREVDNPKYLSILSKIDTLDKEISNLQKQKYPENQIQFLVNAKYYLKKAIDFKNRNETSFFGEKWTDIKNAKKELDKSGLEFHQTIKKKYSLAIDETEKNILRIDDILKENIKKDRMINKIKDDISDLTRKINNPFNPIKKKILKDIPIGEIERNILILDTINVFSEITGKFVAVKNNQYNNGYIIMKQDYKEFVKNELVLGKIIENKIEDAIGSVKNLNRLTDDISTYVYRDENDNSYVKYSNDRYLIKNLDNNKLYFTNDNILDKVAIEENELNSSKNGKDNNLEITSSSLKQYNVFYKQALKELDIVTKHRQSYNSSTLTSSRLAKWKNDTKKLISTYKKMNDLNYGKYKNNTSSDLAYQYFMNFNKQLTREQVSASIIISDMIRECKQIIGM
jgi:hypothetical protein